MATSILGVKWERFFVSAGIPAKIAGQYAKKFSEQRVQFEMLGELTKPILVELGITALGDQMAILHQIKMGKEGNQEKMDTTAPSASRSGLSKKVLKAPDRDDIYHVRMPSGITPKTKEIMEKQTLLRYAGLMTRGMNGVRQSGQEVRPMSKRLVSRIGNGSSSSTVQEVSSTTSDVYERLGVRGLVSDTMPEPKVFQSAANVAASLRFNRKKKTNPAALFKRSVGESTGMSTGETVFRVRIPEIREAVPPQVRSNVRGRIAFRKGPVVAQERFVTENYSRVNTSGMVQKRRSVMSRLSVGGARTVSKKRFAPQKPASVFDRLG